MLETATVTMSLSDYEALQREIENRGHYYDQLAQQIREAVGIDTGDYVGDEIIISYIDEKKLLELMKNLFDEEDSE